MRREIERLRLELSAVTMDRDRWYMRANYSPEEIEEFRHRVTMGLDPETGEWLSFEEQERG